jgi:membrane-associated HD superfamily phosphohydrolase
LLHAPAEFIQKEISELKEKLGTPQRKYQGYLDKLSKWTTNRLEIIGEDEDPKPETIKNLENQIKYIETELSQKLTEAYSKRKEISEEIFQSKERVLKFYSELKQSVESKLASVRTDDFSVNIEAALFLKQSFNETFLNYINKNKTRAFYSIQGVNDLLNELLLKIDWNDFNSVYNFIENTLEKLKTHNGKFNPIRDQITEVKEFYNFLFSLDYFPPDMNYAWAESL